MAQNLSNLFKKHRSVCLLWLLTALLGGSALQSFAQGEVRGVIKSADGSGVLPGVNVLVKGTQQGTVSDGEGKYVLRGLQPDAVLVFSFIGYKPQEATVGKATSLDITLELDAANLHEVVVVGYGAQKKENLSGAVDVVDSKMLEARPIQNVAQGLQGAVPNLNIDFVSGEPGQAPNINIRGFTSINGGNPLILVDNVPMDAAELSFIAPSDIKSISVLKDASSAAIYGARAAYGVILITTKTGTGEKMSINYSNNFSFGKPTVLPNKVIDPYIYMRLLETSTDNTPWDNVNYTASQYAWAKDRSDNPSGTDPIRLNPVDNSLYEYMGNTDWTKYFLDNFTLSQRHNISLAGKSGKTTYYLSGAYDSQNGALKIAEDKFDRYTTRGKVNFQPYKWLSIGNNTSIALTERAKPYQLSIQRLYDLFPTSVDKNPDGTWANTDVGRVAAQLTEGGRSLKKDNMFQTTFNAEMSFFEDMLKFNSDFTTRRENINYAGNQSKVRIGYGPSDIREEGNNIAYRRADNVNYTVFNAYATFNKALGFHSLNAIAGYNQESNRAEYFEAQKAGVISASLPSIGLATGEALVGEGIREWAIRGAFYRLNYIYKDKYIVEFNGRYDGSSKFPKDKRFGFFPSASAAWKVDGEEFWKPVSKVVNHFKIRGSYGLLGNQFVSEYGYIAKMGTKRGQYIVDGNVPQVVTSDAPVSPNYTWEKVTSANIGADLGFFQHKITASFDYYSRDTKGMLTQGRDLPDVLGAAEPRENAADLRTKGWELSVGYDEDFNVGGKNLRFNSKFTLGDSRSTITGFDNPNKNLTQYYKGMELGEMWGLKSDGLFQTQDEISKLDQTQIIPWGALSVVPGWPKYQDLDGNGKIEKGTTVDNAKDLSRIGNVTPRLRFGLNLGAEWNGFDFRAFFQGIGKMDYYPLNYLYWGFYQQPYAGGYAHLLDFYRGAADSDVLRGQHSQSYINAGLADANTDAKFPVLQSWLADRNLGERVDQSQGLAIPQTRYMLSGAYVRLKNITIGYTFPSAMLQKIKVSRLRVYASGENLAELSGVKKFFDPESITDNVDKVDPSKSTSSGWGYAYPFQRKFSFGLELQF
ncbi:MULTISPECIES: TonB-dependent receptor [Dyadobacter]|uniref:TonB-dependent receptor n=1 Tax=Dyadobacter chenhuakuii TaxID=2909339 RepID=A0ABY4XNB8_9BACT|nr:MULTISPECIES: TonB-dependent receptor [Dyadobacter]MCF2494752.1 TonB-dependent receptor [Dyadobacter chenhuakuii]MCF2519189.1 TonB-dependent receptor [Dyadobacter sp. CY351]USJ31927.1 TonB-dependent receptor [Dyadobacter chenhuakuii]